MKRQKALTHTIYPDENDLDKHLTIACSPGTHVVKLLRTEVDVLNGKGGSTSQCMNTNCANRSKNVFPHSVFFVEFTATSAFVVDKITKGKQPKHCIWYKHNQSKQIDLHDRLGPKKFHELGLSKKTITLRPPVVRVGKKKKGTNTKLNTGVQAPHRTPIAHGARKRAIAAGLILI
jgi:hypothetical protein